MNDELKDKIIAELDELAFLDLLSLDITDLVAHFSDQIDANVEIFEQATSF